ncbi:hypothetical protein [Colwellia sp. PAMC 21821]|uniref:hypothetical protein n=1 Tax=Colwellia sp. PAMC 21821 TaxID=1816219 RepID=UPI0018C8C227|nr:hypothetical protein [Colwellia sp. PAMC 21821]
MLSVKLIKQQYNVTGKTSRCIFLVKLLLVAFITSGCTPSDKNVEDLVNDSNNRAQAAKVAPMPTDKISVKKPLDFAPTVDKPRTGYWLGGSPPINKRSSGIDTYYKVTPSNKPKHLWVTLQFEGVVSDDAFIKFNAIDGAEVVNNQPKKWLLKADIISQVTFEVKVPVTISYLTLYTFQNGRGASRAFLLEETNHR